MTQSAAQAATVDAILQDETLRYVTCVYLAIQYNTRPSYKFIWL